MKCVLDDSHYFGGLKPQLNFKNREISEASFIQMQEFKHF